jgi:hypothetical protein
MLVSCTNGVELKEKPSKEIIAVFNHLDTLKSEAMQGDLIVRLSDDLVSEQTKYINETDQSYSHAGLIIEKDGKKMVCHISPDPVHLDTIQFIPIDSFVNPSVNIYCALYRYNLSKGERDSLSLAIENFRNNNARFDRVYDLATDDKLYCSEMIYKSLKWATHGRIICKESLIPKRMLRLMTAYFKKEHATVPLLEKRKIMTIDNLYLMPNCSRLIKIELKRFPGQK